MDGHEDVFMSTWFQICWTGDCVDSIQYTSIPDCIISHNDSGVTILDRNKENEYTSQLIPLQVPFQLRKTSRSRKKSSPHTLSLALHTH